MSEAENFGLMEWMKRIVGVLVLVALLGVGFLLFRQWEQRSNAPPLSEDYFQSADGTIDAILDSERILKEALERNDLESVHDYMYYLKGLIEVLYERIDPERQQTTLELLKQVVRASHELDHFAGRGNRQAAEVSMNKLIDLLHKVGQAFRPDANANGNANADAAED